MTEITTGAGPPEIKNPGAPPPASEVQGFDDIAPQLVDAQYGAPSLDPQLALTQGAVMSAEACDTQTVQGVLDDRRLELIIELANLGESLWCSVAEAAWRGEKKTVRSHLAQVRLVTINALQLVNSLGRGAEAEQ